MVFLQDLLFVALVTSFLGWVGWLWRETKPFSLPLPLPRWFRLWFSIVVMVGVLLPAVLLGWGLWQGKAIVLTILVPYFALLGLQILSESVTLNQFHSCIWVMVPCVYLPYRMWQIYRGLMLANDSELAWMQIFLWAEMGVWVFNYGVHLSQLPRLLCWISEDQSDLSQLEITKN